MDCQGIGSQLSSFCRQGWMKRNTESDRCSTLKQLMMHNMESLSEAEAEIL